MKMNDQEKKELFDELDRSYEMYYDLNQASKEEGKMTKLRSKIIHLASEVFFKIGQIPSQYLENRFPEKKNVEILETIKSYEVES